MLMHVQSMCSFFLSVSVYFTPQTSLTSDTDAALSNMKEMGDVVRDDHQSLVSHVCKHFFLTFFLIIHPAVILWYA